VVVRKKKARESNDANQEGIGPTNALNERSTVL
jgi:hypothetical protein